MKTAMNVLSKKAWRIEFEMHLSELAKMCNPDISEILIEWTNDLNEKEADFKSAKKAFIGYNNGTVHAVNVECSSSLTIVSDVWRCLE